MFTCRTILPLFAIACGALAEDNPLVHLLPANPATVSGFNVRSIVASSFGQELLGQMKDDEPRLRQLLEFAGVDPRRDLSEVVLASYARPGAADQTLVLARGTFDVARVRAQLLRNGPAVEHLGVELLKTIDGGAVAFPGNSLAIAGDGSAVREILASRKQGQLTPELSQRIRQLSTQYDVWMFTANARSTMSNRVDDGIVHAVARYSSIFRGVNQASGGIKLGDLVTISGEALMKSEKDAASAADVLSVLSSLARMAPDKLPNADFMLLLEGMQVRAQASSLALSFSIPQAQLIRLFNSSAKPAREALI